MMNHICCVVAVLVLFVYGVKVWSDVVMYSVMNALTNAIDVHY